MIPLVITLLLFQPPPVDSAETLTRQGRQAMARNDFDAARTAFTQAVLKAPASPQARFLLGFFHYVDNDFVQAETTLRKARELAPQDPRTALFLALTLDGLARPAEAAAAFEVTLQLEAKAKRPNPETHIAYARMLFAEGRLPDAQQQVSRALTLNPRSREAHYEQARLRFEAGNFPAAIAEATLALPLPSEGTTDRQLHFLLSRAFGRLGNTAKADEHRRAFEAIPAGVVR